MKLRCSHHFSSCFVKTQVYNTVLVFISLRWEYTLAACWDNSFLKCLFHCQSSRKKDCHIPADFHTGYNIKIYQKCERKDLFFCKHNIKTFLKFTGDITRMTTKNMATPYDRLGVSEWRDPQRSVSASHTIRRHNTTIYTYRTKCFH